MNCIILYSRLLKIIKGGRDFNQSVLEPHRLSKRQISNNWVIQSCTFLGTLSNKLSIGNFAFHRKFHISSWHHSRSFFSFCRHQIQFHFVTSTCMSICIWFQYSMVANRFELSFLVDWKTPGVIWLAMIESNILISKFLLEVVN